MARPEVRRLKCDGLQDNSVPGMFQLLPSRVAELLNCNFGEMRG
jgi:hypothetical protein